MKATITVDLALAARSFALVGRHPSQPYRLWKNTLDNLRGIEEVLSTIERVKPGVLRMLELSAYEELQLEDDELLPEIRELLERYGTIP